MASVRRAVIDVGTNSIKLLVADVVGREVHPVWEESKQTRLGQGFYESQRLQLEPVAYSANAVADFAGVARQRGARSIRVVATSAARDAVNADDLISAVEAAAGLAVQIISGEQEAEWAFRGVTTDPALADQRLLLLDVGGGSTEFILGHGERKDLCHSFPLGTVRLLERIPTGDPPARAAFAACRQWLNEFVQKEIHPRLESAFRHEAELDPVRRRVQLVGTGGTATILARMEAKAEGFDRMQIEAVRLSLDQVKAHREQLWSLPLTQRRQVVGLPKMRADVILPGVAIFEAIMEGLGFSELRVSTRGLRFAAVMDEA